MTRPASAPVRRPMGMTRTYACKRLLEHGRLTMGQIVTITGWPPAIARSTVAQLIDTGIATLAREAGTLRPFYMLQSALLSNEGDNQ